MNPLSLVPVAVLVLAIPTVVAALSRLAQELFATRAELRRFNELQPALLRVRDDVDEMRRRAQALRVR